MIVMCEEEDEGVYEESPDSSQHVETLSNSSPCSTTCPMVAKDDLCVSCQDLPPPCLNVADSNNIDTGTMFSIITADVYGKMSCLRMSCFLFSIAICVTYVATVLWLIPCQLVICFPRACSTDHDVLAQEWLHKFPFHLHNERSMSGILALRGTDGKEVWKRPFYTDVTDVLCNAIDVNADGIYDCIVTGMKGLVAAMSASTGEIFWYLHNHDHSVRFAALSSAQPLTDTDFDDDGVNDLITIAIFHHDVGNGSVNLEQLGDHQLDNQLNVNSTSLMTQLLFVSGGTGQTIGRSVPLPFLSIPSGSAFSRLHNTSVVLPIPVLHNLGNGTLALLLFNLAELDGNDSVDNGTEESVYLLHMDNLYHMAVGNFSCESNEVTDVPVGSTCFQDNLHIKEIYSGKHILLVQSMPRKHGTADVLIYGKSGEIKVLDGSRDLQLSWTFKLQGHQFSKPVFGFWDDDAVPDVFFTATPMNCSEVDCDSQAIICDGKDGHILKKIITPCTAFSPIVITDQYFMFKTPVLSNRMDATRLEVVTSPNLVNDLTSGYTPYLINGALETEYDTTTTSMKNQHDLISNPKAFTLHDRKWRDTKWPVKLATLVGGSQGNRNSDLSTGETAMCHSDPEEFYTLVFKSNNQWLLISVQNKEEHGQVSLVETNLLSPK